MLFKILSIYSTYSKLLLSTPWSKKTLTRFFSGSKTIAEIVLHKIEVFVQKIKAIL
jgi:hypothetical protein